MSTVNQSEIDQFNDYANSWWDENGPFKPLHQINPTRLKFIKNEICQHYRRDPLVRQPFTSIDLIDVGCGGGLITEPMARLGAAVTGLDAGDKNIAIAIDHARHSNLQIDYIADSLENHLHKNILYDTCLALEIIEHVDHVGQFIEACAATIKPGGLVVFSTLNRTWQSIVFGIGMAEYILRWVPRGTHTWSQFLKPSEIITIAEKFDLQPLRLKGMSYNPLSGDWFLSNNYDINYFLTFSKKP